MSLKSVAQVVFLVVLGMLSGCGTARNLIGSSDTTPPLYPFGGTAFDVDYAIHGGGLVEDILFIPLAAIDIPFSIVGDVATLPLTVSYTTYARWRDSQRIRSDTRWWKDSLEPERVMDNSEHPSTEWWNELPSDEQSQLPPAPAD